jgi:hypothetical protein
MASPPDPRYIFASDLPEALLRNAGWLSPAEAQAMQIQLDFLTERCRRLEAEDATPLEPDHE